jgi:hypothetical protein
MSANPFAVYTFLSWVRQGLGVHTQNPAAGQLRGTLPINVTIRGKKVGGGPDLVESVPKDVELYGPGDIIGVDAKAVIRTEPRNWITNFESNYLACIEFYDEDFPWRYTPAAPSPDQKRLAPWLALVVLEEGEFGEGKNVMGRPLPYITVANAADKFPLAGDLWAWAHVHMNTPPGVGLNDTSALAQRVAQVVGDNRDAAYSRLVCPRTLKANKGYHAFLIPAFETGRKAGLGQVPTAPSATTNAWADAGAQEFPVYYRWYFRTGTVGDFEYLVRLLKPKPADVRVGRRDMDVQAPGSGMPGITESIKSDGTHVALNGILRLGGALRVPLETMKADEKAEHEQYDEWADLFPQPFQTELAKFLNLPADYEDSGTDEDPLIAPPIYGRWHAAMRRLLEGPVDPTVDRERWINELNLDPRFRVAAGFGTGVVQKNQEEYMEAAWLQVGKVLAGNQRIRYALMALAASKVWNTKHLEVIADSKPEKYLTLAAPVHRRVLAEGMTVQFLISESTLPPAALSKTMRQVLRPRWRVAKRVGLDDKRTLDNFLDRINLGEVVVAPPMVIPPSLPTPEKAFEQIRPKGIPQSWIDALKKNPWLRWLPLIIAVVILILLLALGLAPLAWVFLALAIAAVVMALWVGNLMKRQTEAESILPENRTPEAIDQMPKSPNFEIGVPGTVPAPVQGATDSPDATRFKEALRNSAVLLEAERAIPVKTRLPLDLRALSTTTFETLRPEKTIPHWTALHVLIPERIKDRMVEDFGEVMVYPEIDLPMYKPLKEISSELFLPNIHLIEQNSITLLETNQKFIEAYMVGLNHEFARELLWREYPTDQRGSYFRQFWDVSGFLEEPGIDKEDLRKKLLDIPEIHTWSVKNDDLGDHDHREADGAKEEELVLVIRGELLKKYPNAVVYAHRAKWQRNGDGTINNAEPRLLEDIPVTQEAKPPRTLVKTPLYEAQVAPDIYFFGFDLTAKTAKGGEVPVGGTEKDPGWFFVIKERPSEPRFGLDIPKAAPQAVFHTWNDLAWSDVMVPFEAGKPVPVGQRTVSLTNPGAASQEKKQYDDDKRFEWRPDTNAAELAYILYQVPVLMAVHAAEMLPKEN